MPSIKRYVQLYKQKWRQVGGQEGIVKRFLHGTATSDFKHMAHNEPLNPESIMIINKRKYYAYPRR